MIVRSNTITLEDLHAATRKAGVRYQDTYSREGWYVPVREFTPRSYARGFEFFLSGSSRRASAHDPQEKAATWIEWGIVIDALFTIDPDAQVGFYANRRAFIEYTSSEAARAGCEWSRSDMPWLKAEATERPTHAGFSGGPAFR